MTAEEQGAMRTALRPHLILDPLFYYFPFRLISRLPAFSEVQAEGDPDISVPAPHRLNRFLAADPCTT